MLSQTESILESISDGVFTVDSDWRITSFNRAAEKITECRKKTLLAVSVLMCFVQACAAMTVGLKTLRTLKPVIGKSGYIIRADGSRIPISVSTAVLKDADGNVTGGAETFRDLSEVEELRRELEEKFRIGDLKQQKSCDAENF